MPRRLVPVFVYNMKHFRISIKSHCWGYLDSANIVVHIQCASHSYVYDEDEKALKSPLYITQIILCVPLLYNLNQVICLSVTGSDVLTSRTMTAQQVRPAHNFWDSRPIGPSSTTQSHPIQPPPVVPLFSVRPTRAQTPPKKQDGYLVTTSSNIPSSSSQRLNYELEVLDSLLSSSASTNHDQGTKKQSGMPGTSRSRGRPKGSLNKKEVRMSSSPSKEPASSAKMNSINFDPAKVAEFNDRVAVGERSEIREYKCKLCPLRFFNRSDVVMHTRSHTEGKPFKCAVCNKGFASTSYLNQHSRIHTGEKPYSCTFCDKTFRQLSHLQQHTRTHTGQRPYRCAHAGCDKAFTQLSNLQQHWRRHNKDKPYKCPDCYRAFDVLEKLQNHVQSHENTRRERRFSCGVCGKSYVQELYLERHLASKHPQEPQNIRNMNNVPSQVPFKRIPSSAASHMPGVAPETSQAPPGFPVNQELVIPRSHSQPPTQPGAKTPKSEEKEMEPVLGNRKHEDREKEPLVPSVSLPSSLYPQVHFPLFNAGYAALPGFSSLRS
ncbi:hypothetical protein HOLleu_39437 [Holothuria leucospilota]|uniref:C2H2-type domain-containing protein n=1 Tax=Holothuria leucospilota TaxID=206669 RepID=A0A9Q1BCY8_HOLLE|nr:hypothetical protein HOLleu_39437 [Holothuria leucospilota]